ncbi:hypothetical protein ABIE41_000176 [Bosea sp. OAE506]|uniref:hypothetical protein n=1 Tax=Bosea sp. OAE506 TaxID=2663870 RepID=UPI00178A1522
MPGPRPHRRGQPPCGDALDLATLAPGFYERNPKRTNVGLALAMAAGIGVVDLIAAVRALRRRGAV